MSEKSPREIAKEITEGKRENQHIGKRTLAVYQQELFSLMNTKPAFRDSKWIHKYNLWVEGVRKDLTPEQEKQVMTKAHNMLNGEL